MLSVVEAVCSLFFCQWQSQCFKGASRLVGPKSGFRAHWSRVSNVGLPTLRSFLDANIATLTCPNVPVINSSCFSTRAACPLAISTYRYLSQDRFLFVRYWLVVVVVIFSFSVFLVNHPFFWRTNWGACTFDFSEISWPYSALFESRPEDNKKDFLL